MKNFKIVRLSIIVLMLSFATATIMQDYTGDLGGTAIAYGEVNLQCESWVTIDGKKVSLACQSYYNPYIQRGTIELRGMDTLGVSNMTALSVKQNSDPYKIGFDMKDQAGTSCQGIVNLRGLNPSWGTDMRNLAKSKKGDGWDITFMMWMSGT